MNSRCAIFLTVVTTLPSLSLGADGPHANVGAGCVTSQCHVQVAKKKFKHDFIMEGECNSCHVPPSKKEGAAPSKIGSQACTTCHTDFSVEEAKAPKKIHEVMKEGCSSCHAPHDSDQSRLLTDKVPDLCTTCHTNIQENLDKMNFKHGGLAFKEQCMTCHDPHLSDQAYLLKKQESPLCFGCHGKIEKEVKGAAYKHGPVAKGDCVGCHQIHEPKQFPKLLKTTLAAGLYAPFEPASYAFCFSCHEHDEKMVKLEQTDAATNFRNGTTNLHFVHVRKGFKTHTCRNCHSPHASSQPKLIRTSVSFFEWEIPLHYRPTKTGGSCESGCHPTYSYDREKPARNVPEPAL
ncbi:MAG: cytochrome c3 family protein [Pseudomonadota bacterium]